MKWYKKKLRLIAYQHGALLSQTEELKLKNMVQICDGDDRKTERLRQVLTDLSSLQHALLFLPHFLGWMDWIQ